MGHVGVGTDTQTVASVKTSNASSVASFWGDSIHPIFHVAFHPHPQFSQVENVIFQLLVQTNGLGALIYNTMEMQLKRQSTEGS